MTYYNWTVIIIKKIICFFTCLIITFVFSVISYASDGVFGNVTTTEANIGDVACISVNITKNSGFAIFGIAVRYDENNLFLSSYEMANLSVEVTDGTGCILLSSHENVYFTGELIKLYFIVKNNAYKGVYNIDVASHAVVGSYDINGNFVDVFLNSGSITVLNGKDPDTDDVDYVVSVDNIDSNITDVSSVFLSTVCIVLAVTAFIVITLVIVLAIRSNRNNKGGNENED